MVNENLIAALRDGNLVALMNFLNAQPCNSETLTALEERIELGRVELIHLVNCYQQALDEHHFARARSNLMAIPTLHNLIFLNDEKALVKKLARKNSFTELKNILTFWQDLFSGKLKISYPGIGRLLVFEYLPHAIQQWKKMLLSLNEKNFSFEKTQKKIEKNSLYLAILKELIHSDEGQMALEHFPNLLIDLYDETNSTCLPFPLRNALLSSVKLYGIYLHAFTSIVDIKEFSKAPGQFLKAQGASLQKQMAANYLKVAYSILQDERELMLVGLPSINQIDLEKFIRDYCIAEIKKAFDHCHSIAECQFLCRTLTYLSVGRCINTLTDEANEIFTSFPERQVQLYESFINALCAPEPLRLALDEECKKHNLLPYLEQQLFYIQKRLQICASDLWMVNTIYTIYTNVLQEKGQKIPPDSHTLRAVSTFLPYFVNFSEVEQEKEKSKRDCEEKGISKKSDSCRQ